MGPQGSAYWRRVFYSECLNKEKHPKRNLKRKHPKRAEKVNIQRWIKKNLTGSYKTRSNNHKLSSNRNTKNKSNGWKQTAKRRSKLAQNAIWYFFSPFKLSCYVEQSSCPVWWYSRTFHQKRGVGSYRSLWTLSRSLELTVTAAAEIVCRAATLKYTN